MTATLLNVLPVFLLIFIGWLAVRTGLLGDGVGEALGEFVFRIAVPVLLFRTIAEAEFHGQSPFRLWIAYFGGVAVTWAAGHLLATRLFRRDLRIGVLAGVSSAFANNVFIGLPLVGRMVGDDGIVALSILLAVHLPVMMIAGTLLMERAERRETGVDRGGVISVLGQVGRNLLHNPLVIGLAAGSVFHLGGVAMPATMKTVVDQIAATAGPAALISLGMALKKYGVSGNLGLSASISVLKLVLLPASVYAASRLVGLTPEWTAAMVLTSAVPTGINAWLIANRFGVGHSLAASTITMTTAAGVLTVTLWSLLLGGAQ